MLCPCPVPTRRYETQDGDTPAKVRSRTRPNYNRRTVEQPCCLDPSTSLRMLLSAQTPARNEPGSRAVLLPMPTAVPSPKFPPEANIYTVDCVRVPMCVCGCGCGWMAARRDVSLLQIAKALGLECTAMINANRKKFPSLRAGTKFQAGTTLALPQEGDAMEE